ncbi:MAG: outer membrane lipoprotein chaperone LolA [candidate division WOR-3 bacterium]|nr:outer membrane lipoprotein chaperone LolA [candidate division WOR-3 bacterium]
MKGIIISRNKNIVLLLVVHFFVFGFGQDLDTIIKRTVVNYQNLKSFYIEFKQQFCEKGSGICQTFDGAIYFLKPNFFRMEIKNPKQIYVGDSASLWIYLPDRKKAIRQHLGTDIPFAINPDIFLKNYEERFNAELKKGQDFEIILTPKEETEIYKKIIVVIDPQKYEIKGLTILDETESENKFIFKNIQLNKKISKKIFEFKPPKGTEVIEQ